MSSALLSTFLRTNHHRHQTFLNYPVCLSASLEKKEGEDSEPAPRMHLHLPLPFLSYALYTRLLFILLGFPFTPSLGFPRLEYQLRLSCVAVCLWKRRKEGAS
jgi:hypothetical protein